MSESRSRNASAAAGVGLLRGGRISPLAVPALDSEELRQGRGSVSPIEGTGPCGRYLPHGQESEPPKTDSWSFPQARNM
jgi:hypothetical protein